MRQKSRNKLSPQAWIDEALKELSNHAYAGLSVVKLAERLGVTRGSFYHHFNSLNDLIDAMIAQWEEQVIDKGFKEAYERAGSPTEEVRLVIEFIARLTDKQDLMFRQWAAHNEHVRAHMARLDKRRLGMMTEMFERLAGDKKRGQAYAKIAFYGYIGCLNSYPRPSPDRQKELALEILELFQHDIQRQRAG
ncbi:MAG: TetR/AcrR family transcriptional regulator [Oleiphilaceae bacterium]|nr:TetR/AcrR family transcriptional regulator [Oleiphilaceae bacterium]